MPSQGIPLNTHASHVLSVSLRIFSVGTINCHTNSPWYDLSLGFDTRAAIHVCPWRFGEQSPKYESQGHSGIVGSDGTPIPVHGIRTIFFKMLPDKDVEVCITFTVCAVQRPITSFRQMLNRCYGYALTSERMELQLDKDFKIPILQERHNFYLKPIAFVHEMGDCHSIPVLTYQDSPLKMIAPSYTRSAMNGLQVATPIIWNSTKIVAFCDEFTHVDELLYVFQNSGCFLQVSHLTTSQ